MGARQDEQLRLQTLADYSVMDTAPDEILDRLVALASEICEAPIALVSLVDSTRQWFVAKVGLDATETPREYAFCALGIAQSNADLFTVPDARKDPRFETNPLVTGAPNVVFYAGMPLVVENGARLGTLCVIDRVPRVLSPLQERSLAALAELVVKRLQELRQREQQVAIRRGAEADSTAARLRLEKMFENAPAFVAVLRGPTHVFEIANRAYQQLVGDERPLIGLSVAAALPEIVAQGFIGLLDGVYRSGEAYLGNEVPIMLSRAGAAPEQCFVNFVYQPWRENGEVAGIDVFGFDVTPQVDARERMVEQQLVLTEREQRLRQVVEAAGAGTWELDARTMEIDSNERMIELMGLPVGTQFSLASGLLQVPEPDRTHVSNAVAQALAGANGGTYRMEFRTGGADGVKERWVDSRAQAYFDAAGSATKLTGAMIEVTTRKEIEEERRRASERVTHLLETMSDGFLSIDTDWRLTFANASFERITGLRREDAVGRPFWDVFPRVAAEKGPTWTNYIRSMTERVSIAFQSYNTARDGWTDQRVNPTEDGGIAVFFHDITIAKRAEQALAKQSAFERQLIGIVSHDLRNPLGVVEMATTLLESQPELTPMSQKFVTRARRAALRATDLIRDLLDFTQARVGGGIRVERSPTDLNAVTREVIGELEATHPTRTIAFRTEGDGRGDWDGPRLAQVVQNLVSNALKYSAPNSTIEVETKGRPDQVLLTVRNVGTPIPEANLASMFEPFERGSNTDASSRSVGLGLYIVKQIVSAHQGSIRVQSTAATGTLFTVSLPRMLDPV